MKARAALLVAAGVLLAGCGIPTTGVVEAGEPAVGVHTAVTLYFVRVQDGALATVQRRVATTVSVESAVGMLVKGLAGVEQKFMGLTSALPPPGGSPTVDTEGATTTVDLPSAVPVLSGTAVDQVVCTVLAARSGDTPADVVVTANGRPMPPDRGRAACTTYPAAWSTAPGSRVSRG